MKAKVAQAYYVLDPGASIYAYAKRAEVTRKFVNRVLVEMNVLPFKKLTGDDDVDGDGIDEGPCKFFASGSCNFGDRCKLSHELGAGKGGGSSSNMSPFGMSSGRQLTNTFSGGGNKPPCKFFASGSCRNGNSCQFSHSSTPFGSGGVGQSNNPSPFTGGASGGDDFGSFGLGAAANPSPFRRRVEQSFRRAAAMRHYRIVLLVTT
jgi:hypothetical protein